jgi:hypothetical protein
MNGESGAQVSRTLLMNVVRSAGRVRRCNDALAHLLHLDFPAGAGLLRKIT